MTNDFYIYDVIKDEWSPKATYSQGIIKITNAAGSGICDKGKEIEIKRGFMISGISSLDTLPSTEAWEYSPDATVLDE